MPATPSSPAAAEERPSSRPLLILLIALCTVLIVTYATRLDERDGVQVAIGEQQARNEEARARTAALQKELESVARPAYVDEVARRSLGLGKEGDVVIVAVGAPSATTSEAGVPLLAPAGQQPVWRQWLILFTPDS